MNDNILEIKNILKEYHKKIVLNNINMSVPKGCIYGLLGPNGAGKTTLMKIINQITAPDQGEILFNNEKLERSHVSNIGYLPEERGLYKKMKVGEQCLYLAQLKGLSRSESIKRLEFWFHKLEISEWWNKKIEELSKGMAQKIQFAVTVLHEPNLLIFDEPFSGFDPVNTAIIRDEIIELKNNGTSIIFSTHRMESVEEMCDEITLINHGECVLSDKINNIKNNFKDNMFKVELESSKLTLNNNYKLISQKENEFIIQIIDGSSSRDLLNHILDSTNIISFKEHIPSMEEIFIKSINNG